MGIVRHGMLWGLFDMVCYGDCSTWYAMAIVRHAMLWGFMQSGEINMTPT